MPTPQQIVDDLGPRLRGRVHGDVVTRGLYSTDASIFRIVPAVVVVPRDEADVRAVVQYCHANGVPVVARGAGTGLAGESLGSGVILDLSVHFRAIIDVGSGWVRVQPGVTLAALNDALAVHGRRFAPDPASAAVCTLGGMIATNASGGTAFRHGTTRDHVRSLRVVRDDGEIFETADDATATAPRSLALRELLTESAELLAANPSSGYHFHDVLTPAGVDLPKLLVGSEGTLGIVTEATLRTTPLAGGTAGCILGFATFDEALAAGVQLRSHAGVAGCDLLDQRLLTLVRGGIAGIGPLPPTVAAALVIDVEAESDEEAATLIATAIEELQAKHRLAVVAGPAVPDGHAPLMESGMQADATRFRTRAVAGLYALSPGRRPAPFVENVVVPIHAIPTYVTRTRDILREADLTASFLVHVLTGHVHCRPLVDLSTAEDREKIWPLAERIHALALSLGGRVTGQHGVGLARTPWMERQAGPLLPLLRDVKRLFDPKGILNPGKIVGPDPSRPAWPLRGVRFAEEGSGFRVQGLQDATSDRLALQLWDTPEGFEKEVRKCTGCGDCRTTTAGRMCPVFRASGDEAATPRAKANLLRDILAGEGNLSSEGVAAVADLCVNCKMCRDECRAGVDIPRLMLEAKAARYAAHGFDRHDWFFARAEAFAALAGTFAFTANVLLGRPWTRWLIEKLFGLHRHRLMPRFTHRTFLRRAWPMGLFRRDIAPDDRKVAYFVDTFANFNDPLVALAAVAVLRYHGFAVHVPRRQRGSGMAALTYGDVETARAAAAYNVRTLAELVRDGYAIVCSEPTAAVALTQEYPHLLKSDDADLVAKNTAELTAFLWDLQQRGLLRPPTKPVPVQVGHHVPCHVKALGKPAAGPQLLALIPGMTVHTIDAGCSGMAGTYGLRTGTYAASLAAGQPMFAAMERAGGTLGSTECGSCRMQMQQGAGQRAMHPVQYLALAYGLLPQLQSRLTRPLKRLVTG